MKKIYKVTNDRKNGFQFHQEEVVDFVHKCLVDKRASEGDSDLVCLCLDETIAKVVTGKLKGSDRGPVERELDQFVKLMKNKILMLQVCLMDAIEHIYKKPFIELRKEETDDHLLTMAIKIIDLTSEKTQNEES
jgi:hypothetical protein